jgi:hypothetical protein
MSIGENSRPAREWAFLEDPWVLEKWRGDFGYRPDLRRELALLEHIFSPPWRGQFLARTPFKHRLPYHLATKGGWARLLDLAAELLLSVGPGDISPSVVVPMLGRLRAANLYSPTLCEIVVAPVLRGLGKMTWQPQGHGHGADYQVVHATGTLVAEVKRICSLRNLRPYIERWLRRPWARSVDLVAFVEYESCDGWWSTTVEPAFSRTHGALTLLARAMRLCKGRHLHVQGGAHASQNDAAPTSGNATRERRPAIGITAGPCGSQGHDVPRLQPAQPTQAEHDAFARHPKSGILGRPGTTKLLRVARRKA